MPKFTITTLGCKVNQFESEALAQKMSDDGQCVILRNKEIADVCIINTCTVTQKASMQSRQAIRQAIRSNPNARIIVTGCYAQTEPDEIKKIKGVHHVIVSREPSLTFFCGAANGGSAGAIKNVTKTEFRQEFASIDFPVFSESL